MARVIPGRSASFHKPVPARGLLAIGDAATFIDPFTASGILLALQSGKLAAESIVSNFPDPVGIGAEYRKRYAAAFNERLKVSSILRHAFMAPAAAEIALTVLGSSERALRHLASATRSGNPAGA